MAAIWRCPDCETLNSENKCVVCGRIKPELSDNEQTSLKNVSVENHKNPQEQSELKKASHYNNINQENIDHQQNQPVENDNFYTKSFAAVMVMLIIVIILLIVAAFLLIKGVKDDKNEATSTADISTTVQNKDSAVFEEKADTSLIDEEHNLASETEINSDVTVTASFSSDKRAEQTTVAESKYETSEKLMSTVTTTVPIEKKNEQTTLAEHISETSEKTARVPAITTTIATPKEAVSQSSTVSSVSSEKDWNESPVNGVMYTTQACYSRSEPKPNSKTVERYRKGEKIYITAITDTSYYKLKDGSYIHSDYLSENDTSTTEGETRSSSNKEIGISKTACTLTKGYSVYLSVYNCDADDVKWSTSNSDVVTVSDKGKIVGVDEGTAIVYASAYGQECKCEVTVIAGYIQIYSDSVFLKQGEKTVVKVKVVASHAVSVVCSDRSIASASWNGAKFNGDYVDLTIYGNNEGDATIKVYCKNNPQIYGIINVNVAASYD